jgi:hypothetical protein
MLHPQADQPAGHGDRYVAPQVPQLRRSVRQCNPSRRITATSQRSPHVEGQEEPMRKRMRRAATGLLEDCSPTPERQHSGVLRPAIQPQASTHAPPPPDAQTHPMLEPPGGPSLHLNIRSKRLRLPLSTVQDAASAPVHDTQDACHQQPPSPRAGRRRSQPKRRHSPQAAPVSQVAQHAGRPLTSRRRASHISRHCRRLSLRSSTLSLAWVPQCHLCKMMGCRLTEVKAQQRRGASAGLHNSVA